MFGSTEECVVFVKSCHRSGRNEIVLPEFHLVIDGLTGLTVLRMKEDQNGG